jgi:hypothetical protein
MYAEKGIGGLYTDSRVLGDVDAPGEGDKGILVGLKGLTQNRRSGMIIAQMSD